MRASAGLITCKDYEVMSGNCGSGRSREYISRSYRRVRYRLVGYGSSALTIEKNGIHKENPALLSQSLFHDFPD